MKKYETPVIEITEIKHDDAIMAASSLYDGRQTGAQRSNAFANLTIDF